MTRRNERARLLEQVLAGRMPQLEAATLAATAVDRARDALEMARQELTDATESLRQAYDTALAAGWSDNDLALVGVSRPRRTSPGRPRASSERGGTKVPSSAAG